ncbi:unnamed protein product [Mycetohabitans rhizoxinica HKI 454]|uniref:Uncharacterized protein n=1 Tax=Mycetohabitans rhizoxinica (strain DSM 19002 / CIP 109453 / HKI 454) TaxID=882378 RepID=E5APZ4_MYCRK|nr:unnamed protein product [Mycetohabitans rhizoxinica HKI 454]
MQCLDSHQGWSAVGGLPTKPRRPSSRCGQWQDGGGWQVSAPGPHMSGKTSADYAMRRDGAIVREAAASARR